MDRSDHDLSDEALFSKYSRRDLGPRQKTGDLLGPPGPLHRIAQLIEHHDVITTRHIRDPVLLERYTKQARFRVGHVIRSHCQGHADANRMTLLDVLESWAPRLEAAFPGNIFVTPLLRQAELEEWNWSTFTD